MLYSTFLRRIQSRIKSYESSFICLAAFHFDRGVHYRRVKRRIRSLENLGKRLYDERYFPSILQRLHPEIYNGMYFQEIRLKFLDLEIARVRKQEKRAASAKKGVKHAPAK